MLVAKMAGTKILLNHWFIVLFMLFAVSGIGGKALMVFGAVLWHESAHGITAHWLGLKVKEVELLPFGGVARIEGLSCAGTIPEIVIAAAGPLASLVLAAISYIFMNFSGYHLEAEFFYKTNMMLAAFNSLPALPLDGGRIIRVWLACYMGYKKATQNMALLSKMISLLLLAGAMYEFRLSSTVNITFIFAAFFLFLMANQEVKAVEFYNMAAMVNKKKVLLERGLLPAVYLTVVNSTPIREVIRLFKPNQYYILLIVDRKCNVCGTVTETHLWEQVQEKGIHLSSGEFL